MNKTKNSKLVIGVYASLMAVVLAVTAIVISMAIATKKIDAKPTLADLNNGIRLSTQKDDNDSLASNGSETITRDLQGDISARYEVKAEHDLGDFVEFEYKWSLKRDGEELASSDEDENNWFIVNVTKQLQDTQDMTLELSVTTIAVLGDLKSDGVTWTRTLEIKSNPLTDGEAKIDSSKVVYKDLKNKLDGDNDGSANWTNEEDEENANTELGGGYYNLQEKLTGANRIEMRTSGFAQDKVLKMAIHNNGTDGNWVDGAYYHFARKNNDVYVFVGGDTNETVDKIVDKGQKITNFVDVDGSNGGNTLVFDMTYENGEGAEATEATTVLSINGTKVNGKKESNNENNLVKGKGKSLRSIWISGASDNWYKGNDGMFEWASLVRLSKPYEQDM